MTVRTKAKKTIAKNKFILTDAKFNDNLKLAILKRDEYHAMVQALVVSALANMIDNGQPSQMNALFKAMKPSEQVFMKLYVVKLGASDHSSLEAIAESSWIKFESKGFHVKTKEEGFTPAKRKVYWSREDDEDNKVTTIDLETLANLPSFFGIKKPKTAIDFDNQLLIDSIEKLIKKGDKADGVSGNAVIILRKAKADLEKLATKAA